VHQRAYTLIELLTVVIIVGLIAGIGIPPLVRQVGSTPLDRTGLLLRTADRQGRDLAMTGEVEVEIEVLSDGMNHRTANDEARVVCESDVTLTWQTTTGKPLHRFTLDRHGRSLDVVVEIAAGRERRRYTVSGISGEWSQEMPASAPSENP